MITLFKNPDLGVDPASKSTIADMIPEVFSGGQIAKDRREG